MEALFNYKKITKKQNVAWFTTSYTLIEPSKLGNREMQQIGSVTVL